MNVNKWYAPGEREKLMETGHYSYYTQGDGLCSYSKKAIAIKHAEKAGAKNVFSPKGFVVWTR